ncbi:MAG: DinB family protein [Thermomicrobiales bacterium]
MRPADLRLIYEYGYDRNMKLLDQAEKLTEGQFSGEPPFGHDSVRKIFFHIANAEYGWRGGWMTGERPESLQLDDYPDLDSIRTLMGENNEKTLAFIDSLTESTLDEEFIGVPLWQTMTRLQPRHSTAARSRCSDSLRPLARDLDLSRFVFRAEDEGTVTGNREE